MKDPNWPAKPKGPTAANVAEGIEGVAEGVAKAVAGVPPSPRTVAEARLEVQRSRARVEATLDRLESRVVETKDNIKRKVDVPQRVAELVRARPLVVIGAAVAIGLFLGTRGGSSDEPEEDDEYGFDKKERRALDEWRKRRRRMLLAEAEDAGEVFEDEADEPPGRMSRFFRAIGHEAAGVILGVVGAEVAERMYGARAGTDEEPHEGEPGHRYRDDAGEAFDDEAYVDEYDDDED